MIKLLLMILIISLVSNTGARAQGQTRDVLVYMKEDIHSLATERAGDDREAYLRYLAQAASSSQKDLIDYLNKAGGVDGYEGFYISNLVRLVAREDVIKEVEKRDDVAYIEENTKTKTPSLGSTRPAGGISSQRWNMDILRVKEAREAFGVDGSGVTIGFIDSGVDFDHPEIRSNFRGYRGEEDLEFKYNYKDILGGQSNIRTHGTGVVSVASGSLSGLVGGVAPGSQWILARTFDEKNSSNEIVLRAAQWMLEPDGDPSKRPQIINNSWGGDDSEKKWFEDILKTWNYLGIFSVFASGNQMDGRTLPGSIENPASLKDAFAVGSIGPGKALSEFSKLGPSKLSPGIIKPDIVAPGEEIITALPSGKYGVSKGTSLAAPHISGLAALLMELRPDAQGQDIKRVLLESCQSLVSDAYPLSPNMGFGHGIPDAMKAMELAEKMKLTKRISGQNRFDTAVNISKNYFKPGVDTVYLANGSSYIDALVMSTLTQLGQGPLLLTAREDLGQETLDEIKRLDPKNILLIGGSDTIGKEVVEKIESGTGIQPLRIAGTTRFDTAAQIAKKLEDGRDVREVYLVNAFKEVDAISASGPAKNQTKPVLLSEFDRLPEKSQTALEDMGIETITLIGGYLSLSKDLENQLSKEGYKVNRIGGANRYETSILLNQASYDTCTNVFLANGNSSVDALAIGPLAGEKGHGVVLSHENTLPEGVGDYINQTQTKSVTILGGENSISKDLEYDLAFE